MGSNISLQLVSKTEHFKPSCSLSVYLWLWQLLRWKMLETKHLWNPGESHLCTAEANQEILLQQFVSIKNKHGIWEEPVWVDSKHKLRRYLKSLWFLPSCETLHWLKTKGWCRYYYQCIHWCKAQKLHQMQGPEPHKTHRQLCPGQRRALKVKKHKLNPALPSPAKLCGRALFKHRTQDESQKNPPPKPRACNFIEDS